jgi:hypothetical protein
MIQILPSTYSKANLDLGTQRCNGMPCDESWESWSITKHEKNVVIVHGAGIHTEWIVEADFLPFS